MKPRLIFILLGLLLPLGACSPEAGSRGSAPAAVLLPTEFREVTFADGARAEVRVLSVDHAEKTATFERRDGTREDRVPFSRFCEQDRVFLSNCASQSTSTGKRITTVNDDDEGMVKATAEARRTFAEACERARAAPRNYNLAVVKAGFTDPEEDSRSEHMWVADFSFDGQSISGILIDTPDSLKSVRYGSRVTFPLDRLTDWMLVTPSGKIEGGFTEKLMHRRMSAPEQREHNRATGLEWGE